MDFSRVYLQTFFLWDRSWTIAENSAAQTDLPHNLPPLRVPSVWPKRLPTARDACEYYGRWPWGGAGEFSGERKKPLGGLDFSFQRRRATVTAARRTVTAAADAVASARRPQPSPLPRRAAAASVIIIIVHNDTTPTSSSFLLLLFFALVPYATHNTQYAYYYLYNSRCFVIVAQYLYYIRIYWSVRWFGTRVTYIWYYYNGLYFARHLYIRDYNTLVPG